MTHNHTLINKQFWVELIAYFPFTTYRVFDDTDRIENTASDNFWMQCDTMPESQNSGGRGDGRC
jgi:hypothetical protein